MRKHQKKRTSLLLGLLISTVIFTIISVTGRFSIYEDYPLNLWEQPTLTVMFEGVKDGIYPWEMIHVATKDTMNDSHLDFVTEDEDEKDVIIPEETSTIAKEESSEEESREEDSKGSLATEATPIEEDILLEIPTKDNKAEEEIIPDEIGQFPEGEVEQEKEDEVEQEKEDEVEQEKEDDKKEDSNKNEEQDETGSVSFGEVPQDYFDDVLFIGDSRTVGLSEYSYLDNATYYCDTGMSVYSVFDKKIAKIDHKMVTIDKALKKKEFKKIYIMLGVNELGTGTAKTFAAKYQEMLERIQELAPNTEIVVQAIMKLGKKLSDSDPIYNNPKIVERNAELEKLADNKKIFYLDVNEVLADQDGYLPDEHTFDSIHLLAKYYDVWADYLMSNGIIVN